MTGIKQAVGLVLLFTLFTPVLIHSLELESGQIRLEIDEATGTFSLYSLDKDKDTPLSLLYPDDPRTTYLSVVVNNRIHRLSSSSDFKRKSFSEAGFRIVEWSSNQLEIRQEFSTLRSVNSDFSNGIAMNLKIRNVSSRQLSVGLRYLMDTYLGENNGVHFIRSDNSTITGETELRAPYPQYILSPVGHSADRGLMLMLQVPGITQPDSVVFANWKRLNESSWSFEVNPTRSFSSPPYSINDSAMALYYDPVQLEPGEERIIRLALGTYAPGGYLPDSQDLDDTLAKIISGEEETGDPAKEAALVRELLAEIDLLMERDEEIPEEKLELLRQLLETLKARRANFED